MSAGESSEPRIRPATLDDIAQIHAIYSESVYNGTGTFAEVPPSMEEMTESVKHVLSSDWPYLVAELPVTCYDDPSASRTANEPVEVVGFAYAAQFRPRSAYRYCCEDSIYVSPSARGRGVATALLDRLIGDARAAGFLSIMAVIGDSENRDSIGLHKRFGFRESGILKDVGFKFGRWLDVYMMQLDVEGAEEKKSLLARQA